MNRLCIDGNEAVARVAHRLSEIVAIYPITPASPMAEHCDAWSAAGRTNLWGTVPEVIEMQSEAGAAGVLHGAVQKGTLATTFTASQGLLLMIPEMYKLAGELTPCVIHVAARTVATHALSIFGDHSDVMATRQTGFAMLAASSVQEAHDFALIAHAATLRSRIPVLHFFDGFRTSHEIATIQGLSDGDLQALVDEASIFAHRGRGLSPDHPVLRGSAQNTDIFFQAREAVNSYYESFPSIVDELFTALRARVGRGYARVEYVGHPEATTVVVAMGSSVHALTQAAEHLTARGSRVGVLRVRLYRPFPTEALVQALPESVSHVIVLDRTKEPGAPGEPLYTDVVSAIAQHGRGPRPEIIGGRYGLASKEFTVAMAEAVFEHAPHRAPSKPFTIGIIDDVTHTSLPFSREPAVDPGFTALFYGIGSDGTVSAVKGIASVLVGGASEAAPRYTQAYSVYDSKKSGQLTVSHLRARDRAFEAPYLVEAADFVSCHHFSLLERLEVLHGARAGGTLLVACSESPEAAWARFPREAQEAIVEKKLSVWIVDAARIAREEGLGERIGTIVQACFFRITQAPYSDAIDRLKLLAAKTYAKSGEAGVARNARAIDRACREVARMEHGGVREDARPRERRSFDAASPFVKRVTARLLEGEGDLLPVSAMPPDGTFPTGTARWEKRRLAETIPIWVPETCIDCGKCTIVCPHAALRMKTFTLDSKEVAPASFRDKPFKSREAPGLRLSIQVSPDDCTGCGLCVAACPVESTTGAKPLVMEPYREHAEAERTGFDHFLALTNVDAHASIATVKGSQLREPLFEFSGACSGCGETPYLKLLTQLFGDRLMIANATGCSSIFGGNLPTTPWSQDSEGHGPAWANSLFEDNAEFGLGMRLGHELRQNEARRLLVLHREEVGGDLVKAILEAPEVTDADRAAQRARLRDLATRLTSLQDSPRAASAARLASVVEDLATRSVWIVGGDGWAYDIGFGGLDHVLASGRNVNVLVLDTEVYSNTGGQASKATPRGALAKFAAAGKSTAKKDLGRIAMTYEGVYVAQVALGANDRQAIRALLEAAAWPGPSLVIAYSTCIAHGIEACDSLTHQHAAVASGYWPLYRHDPKTGTTELDNHEPPLPLSQFEGSESRFGVGRKDLGDGHVHLLTLAEHDVEARLRAYESMRKGRG